MEVISSETNATVVPSMSLGQTAKPSGDVARSVRVSGVPRLPVAPYNIDTMRLGVSMCQQRECSLHSITSSARVRIASEILKPIALAVLRLMMKSNFTGC